MKLRLLVYIIAAVPIAFMVGSLCAVQMVLGIQNVLGIPGTRFRIGDAVVEKEADWILDSSRRGADAPARIYGFLPRWFTSAGVENDLGIYFAFSIADGCTRGRKLGFEELSPAQETRAAELLRQPEIQRGARKLPFERIKFQGWRALARKVNEGVVIIVPALRVTILASELDLAEAVRLRATGS